MLQRDPAQRFGRTGAQEIKSHPFFKGLNWQVSACDEDDEEEDDDMMRMMMMMLMMRTLS